MVIANILAIALLVFSLWLVVPALLLLLSAIAPDMVKRSQQQAAERPKRMFGVGLLVLIGSLAAIAAIGATPLKPLGALALAGLALLAFIGTAGVATHIGRQLIGSGDGAKQTDVNPKLATMTGSACLTLAGTFPLIGWFIVWPVALVMGAGAAAYALVGRQLAASLSEPAPQPTVAQAPAVAVAEPAPTPAGPEM